jgi:hypothetical protein
MVKNWDKIQAQVYQYYVLDEISLTLVMKKMSKEHGFKASWVSSKQLLWLDSTDFITRERTYRKKLREWNFKRESAPRNHGTEAGPARKDHSDQFASALSTNIDQGYHGGIDNQLLSCQDMNFHDVNMDNGAHVEDFVLPSWNNAPMSPLRNNAPMSPFRDPMFERIIQEMREAPSDCSSRNILPPNEFCNKANDTLLHYVAARGYMSEVLIKILHFCSHHGYAVDCKDSVGNTALHIAVHHDRVENIVPLCAAGARVDISNSLGQLPIHVAVMTSKSPQLLEDLFARHKDGVKAPVEIPSPRAGQVALDLAVERVLNDLADYDCTPATRSILLEVLKRGEMLGDTTFLRAHAEKDQELFERAIMVVGNVWLGKKLRRIMIDVLSAVRKADRG